MTYVLITRPEPQAQELAHHLKLPCFLEPLLIFELLPYTVDWTGITDVIITSSRVFECLPSWPNDVHYWCVGPSTAEAAQRVGISQIVSGPGTAEGVTALIQSSIFQKRPKILYIRGEDITLEVDKMLQHCGFEATSITVYRMRSRLSFSLHLQDHLQHHKIVLAPFYSLRTAEIFVNLTHSLGLTSTIRSITGLALSEKIAHCLKQLPWREIFINRTMTKDTIATYYKRRCNEARGRP